MTAELDLVRRARPGFPAAAAAPHAGVVVQPCAVGQQGLVVAELQRLQKPENVRCRQVVAAAASRAAEPHLGAGPLFGDSALQPIKGQLVHLPPEPLPFILDHPAGYLVPRTDALVVGGTFETGVADTAVDPVVSRRILAANRAFFEE